MQVKSRQSLVSIIIPVFNRMQLLKQTLLSCHMQTYGNIEILLIDDGSEEDIEAIVNEICGKYEHKKKIIVFRQEHLGGNAARNRGISEANGEYIQFLDSDDLIHPQKIEIQVNILEQRTDLDMVYGLDQYFRQIPGDMSELWNMPNEIIDLDRFLADDAVWHTGSPLWKRRSIEKLGNWNTSIVCWQDWEYHILAICKGTKYAHVPMVLQFIRDHEQLRSTNLDNVLRREESKYQAGMTVKKNLEQNKAYTTHRGNLLAIYFLGLAMNAAVNGHTQLLHDCLKQACCAGTVSIKLYTLFLRTMFWTKITRRFGILFMSVLSNYLHLLVGYKNIPSWKTIKVDVKIPDFFTTILTV